MHLRPSLRFLLVQMPTIVDSGSGARLRASQRHLLLRQPLHHPTTHQIRRVVVGQVLALDLPRVSLRPVGGGIAEVGWVGLGVGQTAVTGPCSVKPSTSVIAKRRYGLPFWCDSGNGGAHWPRHLPPAARRAIFNSRNYSPAALAWALLAAVAIFAAIPQLSSFLDRW